MSEKRDPRGPLRPIDRLRSAGGVMQVGTAEDGPIVAAIPTNEKLYFVKTHAVYSVQLADQIDPNRQNPDIPNTQQRELPFGSEHFAVARILLTAEMLFKKTSLGQSFDVKQGIHLTIDLLKYIAALIDVRDRLEIAQQEAAVANVAEGPAHRMLHLPSVDNVEARCDAFAQKAAHVVNCLGRLV